MKTADLQASLGKRGRRGDGGREAEDQPVKIYDHQLKPTFPKRQRKRFEFTFISLPDERTLAR